MHYCNRHRFSLGIFNLCEIAVVAFFSCHSYDPFNSGPLVFNSNVLLLFPCFWVALHILVTACFVAAGNNCCCLLLVVPITERCFASHLLFLQCCCYAAFIFRYHFVVIYAPYIYAFSNSVRSYCFCTITFTIVHYGSSGLY